MRNFVQAFAVAIVTIGVSGCFTSEQRFISASDADYPLKNNTSAIAYNDETKAVANVILVLQNGVYKLLEPDSSQKNLESSDETFLLKDIGDGYFVAQQEFGSSSAWYYDLLRIDAHDVYAYNFRCDIETYKYLRDEGVLDRADQVVASSPSNHCLPTTFDKLVRAFKLLVNRGQIRPTHYVIQQNN